jgi:hypothetical protein
MGWTYLPCDSTGQLTGAAQQENCIYCSFLQTKKTGVLVPFESSDTNSNKSKLAHRLSLAEP